MTGRAFARHGSDTTWISQVRGIGLVVAWTLALAPIASAAWGPSGLPVNNVVGAQLSPRAVTDGRGGLIVAWWEDAGSGTYRIYCQRVDSTGTIRWSPSSGVLVTAELGSVFDFAAAPDENNGILIAWPRSFLVNPGDRRTYYVQRVGPDGTSLWPSGGVGVDTLNHSIRHSLSLAGDGFGGALIAWVDDRTGDDIAYAQRVRSGGSRAWANGVRLDGRIDSNSDNRVLPDGAGGAFFSRRWGSGGLVTYFQRVDSSGTTRWGADGVTPNTPQSLSARMSLPPGGDSLLVVWATSGPSRVAGSWIRMSQGSFSAPNGRTLITTTALPIGLITQADNKSLLVASDSTQIVVVLAAESLTPVSSTTIAVSQTNGAISDVSVVEDGTGGLYVVWAAGGSIYTRHVTPSGTSDWGAAVALVRGVTSIQSRPVAVGGFDLLAAWVDDRNSATTGPDLFAQRVSPSGVTGTYHRILATIASGNGAFSSGGGRTWLTQGDSLRIRFAGTGGNRILHTVVGGTTMSSVPNYTFRNVTGDSTLQVTFTNSPVITQVQVPARSYRAFSVPATLPNPAVLSAFANLMPYDITRWRLHHYEPDSNRYLEPSSGLTTIQPATGYWFIGAKDTALTFSGTHLAETQYSLTLKRSSGGQGWNQFGSPFLFPVAVSQLRLSSGPDVPITDSGNTLTDRQVLEWDPATSTYDTVGVLHPGRAYWLWRQSAAAVSLRFPYEWNPVAVAGGLTVEPLAAGDWSVDVTARAGERTARLVFGAAPVAAGRWNSLSGHAPPAGPDDALSLVAHVADWGEDSGEYGAVFRPDGFALAYDFDASVASGLTGATLRFAFDRLPAGRRVLLSEPSAGWSREVTSGAEVPLALSAVLRRFRLEVLADGPVAPPAPRATALRAVGPNPFREAAALSFTIARGGPLRWDVYDLAGRRVVSGSRAVEAGEHVVTWDGRDEAGHRVEPGLYLLRWQADGRTGTARLVHTE